MIAHLPSVFLTAFAFLLSLSISAAHAQDLLSFRPSSDAEKIAFMLAPGVMESSRSLVYIDDTIGAKAVTPKLLLERFSELQQSCLNSMAAEGEQVLTETEGVSICLYTAYYYSVISRQISSKAVTPERMIAIETLDRALAKLPNYSAGEIHHVQKASAAELLRLRPGHVFKTAQFISCSKIETQRFRGNLRFIITPRTGKDIEHFSFLRIEKEVLIPRDSSFVVKRVKRDLSPGASNEYTVWLEQIP